MEVQQPAGHLDQMLRQTRAHHVQLSQMADNKANMIMTVASILVPLSIRYLQTPQFQPAALIMIGFCILFIVWNLVNKLNQTSQGVAVGSNEHALAGPDLRADIVPCVR